MVFSFIGFRVCRRWLACLLMLLFGASRGSAQMVDLNGDGMSDIWEWIYSPTGSLPPAADPDGDHFTNLQEAMAGTNPYNSNSYPNIDLVTMAGTNITITAPAQLGKNYILQSRILFGIGASTNWTAVTNTVLRSGTNVAFYLSSTNTSTYYRMVTADVDTDGDGVNDWEEYQLGLDPLNAYSNGQMDANGNALTDYQYVTGLLARQNVFTIQATDPASTQPDPGQTSTDPGAYTITRGGFPLNAVTLNLALGGPGVGYAIENVDHAALPRSVVFPAGTNSEVIKLIPLADTNLLTPVIASLELIPGTGYTIGANSNASVVIYPSPTAIGTGLIGQYYTNSSHTYSSSANFNPTNLILTRLDPAINFVWGPTSAPPNLSNGLYSVRWTGQIKPQYSETYVFDVLSDDGENLWVNDQLLINGWEGASGGVEFTGSIALLAGVRYDIRLDYLQSAGAAQVHLNWYSPSQPKQAIPGNFLYPTNSLGGSTAPAAVTSALSTVGFLGQPFSFTLTGANSATGFTAAGLPPGLSLNPLTGLISGTPGVPGDFQAAVTASNAIGVGASVLDIVIYNTGSAVTREVWTNVPGTNVSDIPVGNPPNSSGPYGALQGITGFGTNYGERIQGYITIPATGNYYFWIAGSDSAQLWISDDSDPVNKVLRAWVTPTNSAAMPQINGTAPLQWNVQAKQQSGWLSLVGGQKYYFEVLHKAGMGTNDNWAVGWLPDPSGTNATPAGVVPSYLLSRYFNPLPANVSGTLYSANLLALPGVNSTGVGTATLQVSADGTMAFLNLNANNLAGLITGESINSDPYLNNPSQLIFDISGARRQADGSYAWKIHATGTLSAADIAEIIAEGKTFINIETAAYPNGEINGHLIPTDGVQNFVPPPPPPAWTDDHANANAASRFLTQATYGPSASDIASVQALGYAGWISNQFSLPITSHLAIVQSNGIPNVSQPYWTALWFSAWWQNAITAPDQLRQRVAFALSEIMVVSQIETGLSARSDELAYYYDTLLTNAFGNFRTLLEAVTLSPAMGDYLNMAHNDMGSLVTGVHANENYAREVEQLFSVGLNRLWPDGTLVLNAQGNLVPTYDQNVVMGFASVFTGWTGYQTNQANGRLPYNWYPNGSCTNPMVLVPTHHELGAKLLLDNVMLPPARGNQANPSFTNFDNYCSHDLDAAMDSLFNHANVGPFICRQLIQRLVTSNPSRDYLYRVTQVFNNNGAGVRGDMKAVVQAVLLDYEARSTNLIAEPTFGKQREPVLRVTAPARAFPSPAPLSGTYNQNGGPTITITTPAPHGHNIDDSVCLSFTDTSGNPAPASQSYLVYGATPTTLTVADPVYIGGTYSQTNQVITVYCYGHGLLVGEPVYLWFTDGTSTNSGLYTVLKVPDFAHFTVSTTDLTARAGNVLVPMLPAGGFIRNGTNVTINLNVAHGLVAGESVLVNFSTGTPPNGQYQVATVLDPLHFTIHVPTNASQVVVGTAQVYPLAPSNLARSGNVTIGNSTWNMGWTDQLALSDQSSSSSLLQSPLRSPTVFNFFYPDYRFPGVLASAGMTTPEFQLTSDNGVALQMNFLSGGIVWPSFNTNGLVSFPSGNGAIVLNFGPWMTPAYTSATGIPSLVDSFNALLLGGQLSATAKSFIVNYATNPTNLPYSSPPTGAQMRDRVCAVAQLMVLSSDFTIQK